jgi:hypothetical protein
MPARLGQTSAHWHCRGHTGAVCPRRLCDWPWTFRAICLHVMQSVWAWRLTGRGRSDCLVITNSLFRCLVIGDLPIDLAVDLGGPCARKPGAVKYGASAFARRQRCSLSKETTVTWFCGKCRHEVDAADVKSVQQPGQPRGYHWYVCKQSCEKGA